MCPSRFKTALSIQQNGNKSGAFGLRFRFRRETRYSFWDLLLINAVQNGAKHGVDIYKRCE